MMTLFFCGDEVVDWDSASACNTKRFAKYFWAMVERGIYLPCSQFEAMFISDAHRSEVIDETIEALSGSISEWS